MNYSKKTIETDGTLVIERIVATEGNLKLEANLVTDNGQLRDVTFPVLHNGYEICDCALTWQGTDFILVSLSKEYAPFISSVAEQLRTDFGIPAPAIPEIVEPHNTEE